VNPWVKLLLVLFLAGEAAAADSTSPVIGKPAPTDRPQARSNAASTDPIEQLHGKLAAASEALRQAEDATFSPDVASPAEMIERRFILQRLVRVYQRHIDSLLKLQELQERRARLEREMANWTGLPYPPPYSFLKVDALRQSVRSLKAHLSALTHMSFAIEQELERREDLLQQAGEKLRQAEERLEGNGDAAGMPRLTWLAGLEALRNRTAEAIFAGIQTEQRVNQEELSETRLRLEFTQRQLNQANKHVAFSAADQQRVRSHLEAQRRELQRELQQALAALGARRAELGRATETSRRERELADKGADLAHLAALDGRIEIQREQLENAEIWFQALNRLLDAIKAREDLWTLRWSMADSQDPETTQQAYRRIHKAQAELKPVKAFVEQQLKLAAESIFEAENRLEDPAEAPEIAHVHRLRDLYVEREALYKRLQQGIEATEQLLDLWKQDMEDRRQEAPLSVHLQEWLAAALDAGSRIWQFELFAVQDTIEVEGQQITGKRSVTVGKMTTALAILVVGFWIAAWLSRLTERIAVRRAGMDASHARIARRWMLFLMGVMLLVTSLEMVKIPLTVFAFMGGAVAIGAGFGMQNLLKNLISGLMLLLERPFRPGDLVEVGGIRGRVVDIGMRSSQMRDGNGIETLIPNSTFIEENVTNWTLSSQSVRIAVKVGVAYGSPAQEVADVLLETAERHGLVQKKPPPQVLFEDFGSDALLFGLYVWVELKPEVDWRTVTSDLRYMINKALTGKGIVMAFPQRDVHLDASRPLEVRVLGNAFAPGD
jgi:potassium efflux system protein